MNQILYTGNPKNRPASIKSILRFFSFSLIILGAIFIGKGSYSLYQNYEISKQETDNTVPEISFEQEGNNAIITVSHNKGISKVKYNWEGQVETIKQGNSEKTVILDNISIPTGRNTLYVTAIDEKGKANDKSFEYAYDGIAIEFAVVDNAYLKITASDVKGLSYITYKWNSDEEITAYPTGDDKTVIEQQTEIPSGLNTLYITAVNTENKTLTKTQDVKGNHPPKIELYLQGNDLIVYVSDEEGIDRIIQQINLEEEKIIPVNGLTQYKYRYAIADGENILVKITAIDVEGVGRTFNGKNY